MAFILLLAAAFVIFILGYIFGCCQDDEASGSFVINKSDPSKEFFEIRFEKDITTLKPGDTITFEVNVK